MDEAVPVPRGTLLVPPILPVLLAFVWAGVGGVQRGLSGCRPCLGRGGELRVLREALDVREQLWAGLWEGSAAGLSHRDAGRVQVVGILVLGG